MLVELLQTSEDFMKMRELSYNTLFWVKLVLLIPVIVIFLIAIALSYPYEYSSQFE